MKPPYDWVLSLLSYSVSFLDCSFSLVRGVAFHFTMNSLYAVLKTLEKVYGELQKTGTTVAVADQMHSFQEFNQLVGLNEYSALEKKYGVKKSEEESQ